MDECVEIKNPQTESKQKYSDIFWELRSYS